MTEHETTMPEVSSDHAPIKWARNVAVVLRAIALRPWLWWAGLAAVFRLARRGWWRRPPFLPLPGESYWRFRLTTFLGGNGVEEPISPADVVAYLQWCRRSRPSGG